MLAVLNPIIAAMHADGTLTNLSIAVPRQGRHHRRPDAVRVEALPSPGGGASSHPRQPAPDRRYPRRFGRSDEDATHDQAAQAQPDLGTRILEAERRRATALARPSSSSSGCSSWPAWSRFVLFTVKLDAHVPDLGRPVHRRRRRDDDLRVVPARSRWRSCWPPSGPSAVCPATRSPTASRASTSRSSAGRRSCCRSCSSTWRCRRPASSCPSSPAASSRLASTTAPT